MSSVLKVRNFLPVVLAACALLVAPRSASATTVINNPFGNANATVLIGNLGGDATWPVVLVTRNSDGACWLKLLGAGGLTDNFVYVGGSGKDIVKFNDTASVLDSKCGVTVGGSSMNYNGFFLFFSGGEGRDLAFGDGRPANWISGNGGDDAIALFNSGGILFGNEGNDQLLSITSGTIVYGGDQDDSLCTGDVSISGADGGAGSNDRWFGTTQPPNFVGFEVTTDPSVCFLSLVDFGGP